MTTSQVFRKVLGATLIALMCAGSVPGMAEAASRSSRPSVTLTAPSQRSAFSKEGSGIIPVAWSVTNVPENTRLVLELKHKRLRGSIGGGTWVTEIDAGNSTGSYNWDIAGEGRPSAGTYKLRAYLEQCALAGCTYTERRTKVYAKSKWVHLTVSDSARDESDEGTSTIGTRPSGRVAVSVVMEGNSSDSITLDPDSSPTFLYYPSGDVESCTITAYYEGGTKSLEHGWKNAIKPGDYGRFTFGAVASHPLKALRSVEVVCGNANYRASDAIRFIANTSSAIAEYKILAGTSSRVFKKGRGTREDAEAYCKQAYNDPEIHRYGRVQCYWDGEKFEDVREFKG